ncbi:23S rRNA pseudouridine(1911/1915/1917) synthase RluD [Buchnera aphidicola]|nr:23S rRNA pseudouridine(1911/1915/1917) synthase RluD [Buchnera aphidicola]
MFKIKLFFLKRYKIRLDQALKILLPKYSRSLLKIWILNNRVFIDGVVVNKPNLFFKGDTLTIYPIKETIPWTPEKIDLNIIYEDEHLLIINKPSGLVVHPGAGNLNGTLLNGLLYRIQENINIPRAGIIHRLDKNTTGLLVIAKNIDSYQYLIKELKYRRIIREYYALVRGNLLFDDKISKPIARHPVNRIKMTVNLLGKNAVTHYNIIKQFKKFTYLKIRLETGRTHQIRVHMAWINHPIIGDPIYLGKYSNKVFVTDNNVVKNFSRQALHASTIQLIHPLTNKLMKWNVPIPNDMQCLIQSII